MSEPSEGKRAGRPKNYEGPEDPFFEKFEKHLNNLVKPKRRPSDKALFADIGDLTRPKFDKLKPHLKFLLDLAEHDPHWYFGGQVPLLLRWTKTPNSITETAHASGPVARSQACGNGVVKPNSAEKYVFGSKKT